MSKDLTITNTAWVDTIKSLVNGDPLPEAYWDIIFGTIADRLGYLKANKGGLADANTWTQLQTFQQQVNVTNEIGFDVTTDRSGVIYRGFTGPDSDTSIDGKYDTYRVPTLTANREWSLIAISGIQASTARRRIRVTRPRTADAFTLTLKRGATTLGVIPASQAGWIEFEYVAGGGVGWAVSAWSSNITSLNTDV